MYAFKRKRMKEKKGVAKRIETLLLPQISKKNELPFH